LVVAAIVVHHALDTEAAMTDALFTPAHARVAAWNGRLVVVVVDVAVLIIVRTLRCDGYLHLGALAGDHAERDAGERNTHRDELETAQSRSE
jgi:hypothetical protein